MGIFNFFRKKKSESTLVETITGISNDDINEYFEGNDNANIVDIYGNTMLMRICNIAAHLGTEMTTQLINKCVDKGADINLKNNTGDTALMYALRSQSFSSDQYDILRVTRCFIANGADVNVMKKSGDYEYNDTIMQAQAMQNRALYNLLLESGAKENTE